MSLQESSPEKTDDSGHSSLGEKAVLPQLYSKQVIYIFSIIFSPIFGAVILMSNLKNIGEKKGRMQVLIFGVLYTIGAIITTALMKTNSNLMLPLNIASAIILNEYFWNRYIGKDTEYIKKSWKKPAIISLLITAPFIIAIILSQNV